MWFFLLLYWPIATIQGKPGWKDGRLMLRGKTPCQGRVEVYHNREWGTVGNQKWKDPNNNVICNSLGCGTGKTSVGQVGQEDFNRQSARKVWMDEVICNGNETNLWDCNFTNMTGVADNWATHVTCSSNVALGLHMEESNDKCAGVVKFSTSKGIIQVCHDNNWDEKQANRVCEELNCGKLWRIPDAGMYKTARTFEKRSIRECTGNETSIWQCMDLTTTMPCNSAASVVCSGSKRYRLQGGTNVCSGTLEVYNHSATAWKSVCQDNNNNAYNICSSMRCGNNGTMQSCTGNKNTTVTCSKTIEITLLSKEKKTSKCYGEVHVIGTATDPKQKLAVCSENMNQERRDNLGRVVCRELGCGDLILASKGSLTKDVWPSRVSCQGDEASLWHCLAAQHNSEQNRGRLMTNVICAGSVHVRLRDGLGRCSGRVEVEYEGKWWSVDATNWDTEKSNTVCRQLDCGQSYKHAKNLFINGPSDKLFVWDLKCKSGSKHIAQCIQKTKNDRGMADQMQPDKSSIKLICEGQKTVYLQGQSACSGRVAIESAGKSYWLSGSNQTWHNQTATVVCRQMQCGAAESFSLEQDNSIKTEKMWKAYNCLSNATSLFECPEADAPAQNDNHTMIARVKCEGNVTMRLITTEDECRGQVAACRNGECGGLCEDAWKEEDSSTLCQSLQCGEFVKPDRNDLHNQKTEVKFSSVHCAEGISNLSHCNFVPIPGGQKKTCKPVYVTCTGSIKPKLVHPRDDCLGKVQLRHLGEWKSVCKSLSVNAQNTICRELGCGQAQSLYDSMAPGSGLAEIECRENTYDSVAKCNFIKTSTKTKCDLGGLQCKGSRRLLLLNDTFACQGAVYALNTDWILKKVGYSHRWSAEDGTELCKYLDCGTYHNHSGIDLEDEKAVSCQIGEKNKWDCEQNATLEQQLNIMCTGEPNVTLVSQTNTDERCSGEVTINGVQKVCWNNWNMQMSNALCKELSCGTATSHQKVLKHGQASSLERDFSCTRRQPEQPRLEARLWQCASQNITCDGLVSVACTDSIQFNLTEKCGGQIQVRYRGSWEFVCLIEPEEVANRICKYMSCGNAKKSEGKQEKQLKPLETYITCTEEKNDLKHCVRNDDNNICNNKAPAEVYCEQHVSKTTPPSNPIKKIVGVSVGLLLLVLVVALMFWQRKHIGNCLFMNVSFRNRSTTVGSDDYEDVEINMKEVNDDDSQGQGSWEEMDGNEDVETNLHERKGTESKSQGSGRGGDKDDLSGASSGTEYDDIDITAIDPSRPMRSGSDGSAVPGLPQPSAPLPGCASYEVELEMQEDYDDVTSSPQPEAHSAGLLGAPSTDNTPEAAPASRDEAGDD